MTDSASQSLVERLKQQSLNRAGKFGAGSYVATVEWQAAIRITKLEAERDRLASELDASNNNHRSMARQMAELGARCKHTESELSRVEDRCANMRILLVRVRQLGMTAAWKRLPDGSQFSSIPLFGDIEAALDSLPPLAKRGEQKETHRTKPESTQNI